MAHGPLDTGTVVGGERMMDLTERIEQWEQDLSTRQGLDAEEAFLVARHRLGDAGSL